MAAANTVSHYVELDEKISEQLSETVEREKRSKRAIVEIALSDYFERAKVAAKAARAASKTPAVTA